jgi:hypothetical protein
LNKTIFGNKSYQHARKKTKKREGKSTDQDHHEKKMKLITRTQIQLPLSLIQSFLKTLSYRTILVAVFWMSVYNFNLKFSCQRSGKEESIVLTKNEKKRLESKLELPTPGEKLHGINRGMLG